MAITKQPTTNTESATYVTTVQQVRIVVTSLLRGDVTKQVDVYVDDKLAFTEKARPAIDPLASAMIGLSGYMSRCPHKRVCMGRCADRQPIPFTITVDREWVRA